MASERLVKEAELLRSRIEELRKTELAPQNCWLSRWKHEGGIHIRLLFQDENGQQSTQYIGKEDCHQHYEWETKIARRDELAELEEQLSLLKALIDRQDGWEYQHAAQRLFRKNAVKLNGANSPVDTINLAALYDPGDVFQWDGVRYTVTAAGQWVLMLTDATGTPCYFKDGQVIVPKDVAA